MSSRNKELTATSSNKKLKRKFKDDVVEESTTPKDVKKKPPMPTYCKYNVLKILKENHCLIADEEVLSKLVARNKHYDLDDIKSKKLKPFVCLIRLCLYKQIIFRQIS